MILASSATLNVDLTQDQDETVHSGGWVGDEGINRNRRLYPFISNITGCRQ